MNARLIPAVFILAASWLVAPEAQAQLFGERSVGGSLSRPAWRGTPRTTAAGAPRPMAGRTTEDGGEVGSIRGSERFLRGNRDVANFVGRDAEDVGGFVGLQQGETSELVEPAVEDLQIEAAPDANQVPAPAALPPAGMYRPRLRVAFEFSPQPSGTVSTALARQLHTCPGLHLRSPIEVYLEGETATLRGEVASERDRTLARLMVLFEPGISVVRNELVVTPARPTPLAPTPAATPAGAPTANSRPAVGFRD